MLSYCFSIKYTSDGVGVELTCGSQLDAAVPVLATSLLTLSFVESTLDLFPQSAKRKRGLGQSVKPRKRCKYSHSAEEQNPAPVGTSPKVKHGKFPRPRQGRQPRDLPDLRKQQRGPRQQGRTQKARRKQAQDPGQRHTKQRRGSRPQGPWRQGRAGLLRKQAPKGAFRKQRRLGRKGPA